MIKVVSMLRVSIRKTDQIRIYMGSKMSVIKRGDKVRLIAIINGKRGIVEYKGKRYILPMRILHHPHKQKR